MLVVVGIIVALIALVGFVGPELTRPAKVSAWEGNMKNLQEALMIYANQNGEHYPAPPTSATDITTWLKNSGVGQYLSKPIENPFYKNTTVQIQSGTTGLKSVDDSSLATAAAPVIGYDKTTDATTGDEHFTITWKVGSNTYTLSDGVR
jgi:type II secretory pathway pseudopilin PulG